HAPVAIGVLQAVLNLLLRALVDLRLQAPVAGGLSQNLAALLARVNGSLDAGHESVPSSAQAEQALDELLVRVRDGLGLTEGALPLRRLLLQDVRAHGVTARELAAAGPLEALLGAGVGLHLWHQVLVGSCSGAAAAASATAAFGFFAALGLAGA